MALLDGRTGRLHHLNPSAAMALDALTVEPGTLAGAAAALADRYSIGPGRARDEVVALVEALVAAGLVVRT